MIFHTTEALSTIPHIFMHIGHDIMSPLGSARILLVYFLAAKCLFFDIYCQSPNALLLFMHIIGLDVEAISVSVTWTIAIEALYGFGKAGGGKTQTQMFLPLLKELRNRVCCAQHVRYNNKANVLNLSL